MKNKNLVIGFWPMMEMHRGLWLWRDAEETELKKATSHQQWAAFIIGVEKRRNRPDACVCHKLRKSESYDGKNDKLRQKVSFLTGLCNTWHVSVDEMWWASVCPPPGQRLFSPELTQSRATAPSDTRCAPSSHRTHWGRCHWGIKLTHHQCWESSFSTLQSSVHKF